MSEVTKMIEWIDGAQLTVKSKSVANAFLACGVSDLEVLIAYLIDDVSCARRPKGIGEENYKALVQYAAEYAVNNEPTFIGVTCTNGVSFSGKITKQDYAEFSGVIEALQIWFQTHRVN